MPTWDVVAVAAAARQVRLTVDARRRRTGVGARLGAGPGASQEFHDHRAYAAGDDPRHLDWRVYARSDQLLLRRFRVEVSPRLEVLIDGSASMAITPAKSALAASLAALLITLAESAGARCAAWVMAAPASSSAATNARPQRLDGAGREAWRARLSSLVCAGAAGLEAAPPPLLPGADRYLISDGLCPGGAAAVVARLAQGAGRVCLIQVLTRSEREPSPSGAVRLVDVEGGAQDVVLDDAACAAYRARFAKHQEGWIAALSGRGPGVVTSVAEDGFDAALRSLRLAGVVEASQ